MVGPADEETRERPSVALEAADEAVWLALVAASEADEACLTVVLRVRACDCRSATAREAMTDMLESDWEGKERRQRRERGERKESLVGDSRVQLAGEVKSVAQSQK